MTIATLTEDATLPHRLQAASNTLWKRILPRYTWIPEGDDDYRYLCECGQWETKAHGENEDHLCETCWGQDYFTCEDCRDETHVDDQDEDHPTCCTTCGETRREVEEEERQERAAKLRGQLENILSTWEDDEEGITKLGKLLKAAKRLK